MSEIKDQTAAATVAHHNAVNAREGARLSEIAKARVEGRRRKGMNPSDIQRIVKALQALEAWEIILKRESVYIEPEVLINWKPDLERLAFEPPGPVLPPKRGG